MTPDCSEMKDPFAIRKTVNVVLLGLVFMLLASRTPISIVKTVLYSATDVSGVGYIPGFNGDGYVANAILYSTFAVSNFLAPWFISIIGPKAAMFVGGFGYTLYSAQMLYLSNWFLYGSAVLNGLGAALLWTSQGKFLSINSEPHTVGRNAGLFWVLYQMSGVLGSTFVLLLFRNVEVIDEVTRWRVGWALTAMCLGGQLLVLFLRPTPWAEKGAGRISSPVQGVLSCLRLLTTSNLLLLSFVFLYSGLETSFWAGAFPSSVSFTLQLASRKMVMGLCSVMVPVGSIFGGGALILFKSFVNRVGRGPVVCIGLLFHSFAFLGCLLFLPHPSPLGDTEEEALMEPRIEVLALISFLLGTGDACLNTQVLSLLGGSYKAKSAEAFALMKLVQSIGIAGGFSLFTSTGLRWQLLLLQIVAVISTACFCLVEKRLKRESEDFQAEPPGRQKPENLDNEVLEDHLQPELQRLKNLESIE